MGWLSVVETIDGYTYAHTIPQDDSVDHDESADCVCRPVHRQILGTGQEYAWEFIHHSLDGRELSE